MLAGIPDVQSQLMPLYRFTCNKKKKKKYTAQSTCFFFSDVYGFYSAKKETYTTNTVLTQPYPQDTCSYKVSNFQHNFISGYAIT